MLSARQRGFNLSRVSYTCLNEKWIQYYLVFDQSVLSQWGLAFFLCVLVLDLLTKEPESVHVARQHTCEQYITNGCSTIWGYYNCSNHWIDVVTFYYVTSFHYSLMTNCLVFFTCLKCYLGPMQPLLRDSLVYWLNMFSSLWSINESLNSSFLFGQFTTQKCLHKNTGPGIQFESRLSALRFLKAMFLLSWSSHSPWMLHMSALIGNFL